MSSHPVLGLSAKSFHYASPSYVAATGSQFWSHIYYGRTVHISFSCTDSYVELLHYPRQNLKNTSVCTDFRQGSTSRMVRCDGKTSIHTQSIKKYRDYYIHTHKRNENKARYVHCIRGEIL